MNGSRVLLALSLAYLISWSLVSADNQPSKTNNAKDDAAKKLFDPDPAHPWNRLHQHFFVRALPEGGNYVHHGLDAPPLGTDGSYLLEGDTYEKTIRLLDDFLKAKDDERIKDPLKRALLQRDLWYVFETLDKATPFTEPNPISRYQGHQTSRATRSRKTHGQVDAQTGTISRPAPKVTG
jgi:hypothetical protein